MTLDVLVSKRQELQKKWDENLNIIKSGNIKDAARLLEENRVIRENLGRIKETQAIANSRVNLNIFALKDYRDLRNAIYKAKEKKSTTLMGNIKSINEEIAKHKKVLDAYNSATKVNIKLLIIS
jgi:type I restriction-modification system DNA methylase subunit